MNAGKRKYIIIITKCDVKKHTRSSKDDTQSFSVLGNGKKAC